MAATRTPAQRAGARKPTAFDAARRRRDEAAADGVGGVAAGPGIRWGIYVRISQDHRGEGLGVARQEQDCRRLVAERGGEVVDVYNDNDKSAYRKKVRPNFQRMLDDI